MTGFVYAGDLEDGEIAVDFGGRGVITLRANESVLDQSADSFLMSAVLDQGQSRPGSRLNKQQLVQAFDLFG
jgi:hypothetical protein